METETRAFLILIVNSIAWVMIWMLLNVIFGIYLEYGFFEGSPTWKNILYYVLAILSLIWVIRLLVKKWKAANI